MTRFAGAATLRLLPAILVTLLSLLPNEASGQATAEVIYNHYERCKNAVPISEMCTLNETVRLEPGGTLRVWIKQTKLVFFNYEVRGYVAKTTAPAGQGSPPRPTRRAPRTGSGPRTGPGAG